MQPQDPFNLQPPVPDLPDAALPSVEPVNEQPAPPSPPPQPGPVYTPPQPNPLLPPQQPAPQSNMPQAEQSSDARQGRHHLSSVGKKYFHFVEFDDQEVLLAEIRKHPFGLFIIALTGAFIAFMLLLGVVAIASSTLLETLGFANLNSVVVFAGFLLSVFVLIITAVNAHLYRNNVVFVTNEKLAQILFITLFNRKLSQLSIGDIQDVTVQQNGFVPNLVGYGTLVVETAGEQQNYTFTFVPQPYETSKIIINAHELSIRHYGN